MPADFSTYPPDADATASTSGEVKAVVPAGKYFGIAFRLAVRFPQFLGHFVKKLNSESE
jgi:hypothetical protein